MVKIETVHEQLDKLGFKTHGWGKYEVAELANILLPDEIIYECVNGIYEGGFALLVATDLRVLLVDKKPLNYLTVEDLRFDMINELDYSHRLFGANISISAGNKNLKFRSYNQPRLRKLIGHVQHCMAEIKKSQTYHQQGQNQHLQQINQQLQTYLLAQYQQQQKLHERLQDVTTGRVPVASYQTVIDQPPKPSPELSDYLYAQSLLAQHQLETGQPIPVAQAQFGLSEAELPNPTRAIPAPTYDQMAELYADGMQEIFGKKAAQAEAPKWPTQPPQARPHVSLPLGIPNPLEVNPFSIAYSKLPMALRNRKFGRPSFQPLAPMASGDTENIQS